MAHNSHESKLIGFIRTRVANFFHNQIPDKGLLSGARCHGGVYTVYIQILIQLERNINIIFQCSQINYIARLHIKWEVSL